MPRKQIPQQPELFAPQVELSPGPLPNLPADWLQALDGEFKKAYWARLQAYLAEERRQHSVFPVDSEVFTAFRLTPFNAVRVLLLGQDPYPAEGQAHGLCFSVKPAVPIPASLRNIFRELESDLGVPPGRSGSLTHWAEQGVLMLNAVLTVRAGMPNSHKDRGWESFTDAVIQKVSGKAEKVVFVLWGAYAQKKASLIDSSRHMIISSAHPSPLSAASGFFGSKPFSRINLALKQHGHRPINWAPKI
jgi:uracil-DNA glycosylase